MNKKFKQYTWWIHKKTKKIFVILGFFPIDWEDKSKGLEVFILFQGDDKPEARPVSTMEELLKNNEIKEIINLANYT